MIRPHPPRFLMKRRKTVSVTPAMGARTVAGAMRTLPMVKDAGKVRGVRPTASTAGVLVLRGVSQNLLTAIFYVLSADTPVCDNASESRTIWSKNSARYC